MLLVVRDKDRGGHAVLTLALPLALHDCRPSDGNEEMRGVRIWEHSRRRAEQLIPKVGEIPIVYLTGPVALRDVLRAALLFGLHQLREEHGLQIPLVGRST